MVILSVYIVLFHVTKGKLSQPRRFVDASNPYEISKYTGIQYVFMENINNKLIQFHGTMDILQDYLIYLYIETKLCCNRFSKSVLLQTTNFYLK